MTKKALFRKSKEKKVLIIFDFKFLIVNETHFGKSLNNFGPPYYIVYISIEIYNTT